MNFHSVSDAERALDTLNYSSIKARTTRPSQSAVLPWYSDRAVLAASCGASATQAFARVAGWHWVEIKAGQALESRIGGSRLVLFETRYIMLKQRHIETVNMRPCLAEFK